MTSANGELVIDADGHIVEDIPAILSRMPEPYQAEAQIRKFPLFPPVDHLHSTNLQTMPPGAFANVGPEGWLDFLEDVGIEKTVLYPSEGLRSGKIVNIDWAIDVTRGVQRLARRHLFALERSVRRHSIATHAGARRRCRGAA